MAALKNGKDDVAAYLLDAGAWIDLRNPTTMNDIASTGLSQTLGGLLRRGANVNSTDHDDLSPLYCAARNGQEPVVKMLLDAGADADLVDKKGSTPLDVTVAYGHESIATVLRNHGQTPAVDVEFRV
jgi:ankyrin repeat protein